MRPAESNPNGTSPISWPDAARAAGHSIAQVTASGSREGTGNGDDGALVTGIVNRDERAFEQVFHRHGSAIKAVAMRVLRDPALAEDVLQETLTGFWNAPDRFRADHGSLRSFLTTIAHRRAIDMVRSEVARARREQRPPDVDHTSVEDEALTRSVSDTVRRALADLPKDEREAIGLAYLEGMSYVEVARRLSQPEGTVKSRIRSGMRRLSSSLAHVS
jgi:RNA polymerase sigma-70 factor (ECF subfamily)